MSTTKEQLARQLQKYPHAAYSVQQFDHSVNGLYNATEQHSSRNQMGPSEEAKIPRLGYPTHVDLATKHLRLH
ncbi:unnamed protein product, partial [Dibothriocephalus latus]